MKSFFNYIFIACVISGAIWYRDWILKNMTFSLPDHPDQTMPEYAVSEKVPAENVKQYPDIFLMARTKNSMKQNFYIFVSILC